MQTKQNEIDRKIRRILLEADPRKYTTTISLSKHISEKECSEFSYVKTIGEKPQNHYSTPQTIQEYISFSRNIEILTPEFAPSVDKERFRTNSLSSLESFQRLLDDQVTEFLEKENCGPEIIESIFKKLLSGEPFELPTIETLYKKLFEGRNVSISERDFRWSIKIKSLFSPDVILCWRWWLYLPSNLIRMPSP